MEINEYFSDTLNTADSRYKPQQKARKTAPIFGKIKTTESNCIYDICSGLQHKKKQTNLFSTIKAQHYITAPYATPLGSFFSISIMQLLLLPLFSLP